MNKTSFNNLLIKYAPLSPRGFTAAWAEGAKTKHFLFLLTGISLLSLTMALIPHPANAQVNVTNPQISDAGHSRQWRPLLQLKVPEFKKDTFFISKFGAVADGITLNTAAIQKAIDKGHAEGGGVVAVTEGQWLTGPLELKSDINLYIARGAILQFTGDFNQYPLMETNYEGLKAVRCQAPIMARNQHHIAITGKGIIDGNGDSWRMVKKNKLTSSQWQALILGGGVLNKTKDTWYPSEGSLKGSQMKDPGVLSNGRNMADYKEIKDYLRPNLLSLTGCRDILLEGTTFQNSPAWCLHPLLCENLIIRDIYAKNPWYGQNGDGLDLESCKKVLIENCSFDVGDDGICMKSGRDEQGRKRNAPTEDVLVQYCTVYHAHGGFVIGSEMSGGVKNVTVRHCNFMGTDIGLRFKTTRGRGGIVENIFISDINMQDIAGDAILFDMYYEAKDPVALAGENRTEPEVQLLEVTAATPRFRNFFIKNITCNGADHAIFLRGLPEMPIQNIYLKNLVMKTKRGMQLIQADHIYIADLTLLSAETNPLVKLDNASHIFFKKITAKDAGTASNRGEVPTMEISGAHSKNIQLKSSSFGAQAAPAYKFLNGAGKNALVTPKNK